MSSEVLHKHYFAQRLDWLPNYPVSYPRVVLSNGRIYHEGKSGWECLPSTHFVFTDPKDNEIYHVINGGISRINPEDELLCKMPVSETQTVHDLVPSRRFQIEYDCEFFPEDTSDILPEKGFFTIPPGKDKVKIVISIRKKDKRVRIIHKLSLSQNSPKA